MLTCKFHFANSALLANWCRRSSCSACVFWCPISWACYKTSYSNCTIVDDTRSIDSTGVSTQRKSAPNSLLLRKTTTQGWNSRWLIARASRTTECQASLMPATRHRQRRQPCFPLNATDPHFPERISLKRALSWKAQKLSTPFVYVCCYFWRQIVCVEQLLQQQRLSAGMVRLL